MIISKPYGFLIAVEASKAEQNFIKAYYFIVFKIIFYLS
jgi:hypothetical protein